VIAPRRHNLRRVVDVDAGGLYPRAAGFTDRGRLADPDPAQIETAMKFLAKCVPVKSRRAARHSYDLKHRAESWGRAHGLAPYVSNGALIRTALNLGLKVTRYGPGDINARVYVSRELP
jgi:hypothetical protein